MKPPRRVLHAVTALSALIAAGTCGYRAIEGWPWFDCLYQTVITLSTVGFGETHPLSHAGRMFTMALILASFIGVAWTLQAITAFVVETDLEQVFWRRRMTKELRALNDHVILCGHGRTGAFIADELARSRVPFVVVDRDQGCLERAVAAGHLVVEGDATSDDVLQRAGVTRARAAICALSGDADNVFTTMSLRVLNPRLRIVSRHDEEATREKLLRAGASHVVSPKIIGGHRMATLVLRPATSEFLEAALLSGRLDLDFQEVRIDPGSPLAGRTLQESRLHADFGVLVLAVRPATGETVYLPRTDTPLPADATLVVVGRQADVQALLASGSARTNWPPATDGSPPKP